MFQSVEKLILRLAMRKVRIRGSCEDSIGEKTPFTGDNDGERLNG